MTPANAFKEPVQFGNSAFTVHGSQRGADGVLFAVPMCRFIVYRGNRVTGTNSGWDLGQCLGSPLTKTRTHTTTKGN